MAVKNERVSVADYLAAEKAGKARGEYPGEAVYAVAGETTTHNQIVGNLYLALRGHLKGKPGRVYANDIRVNFDARNNECFYCSDIVVTCDKRDSRQRVVRHPKVIIEVLSESTGRIDRREKFFAYTSIPTLEEYVLVGQEPREATVFRRGSGWKAAEKYSGAHSKIAVPSLKFSLSLDAVYEGV